MELRDARNSDAEDIQTVARASLAASYETVLDDDDVEELVRTEYDADRIESMAADPSVTTVVAATDEGVAGFAQGHLVQGDPVLGDIDWLHVDPAARGEGIGVQLLGEMVDRFEDESAAVVRGHAVEANEDGGAFYEAHGFDRRSADTVDIAGETYDEGLYERRLDDSDREAVVESTSGPDGEELFVDYTGGERGTQAPFYPIYTDRSLEERWGWRCSNCESLSTAMDSSGRIACSECENTRAATRWDNSYL